MIKLRLFGQKRLKLDVDGRIIGLINSKLTFSQSSRLSLKSSWPPHPNSFDQRGWMAAKPGCVQLRQGRQLHRADHVPGASQPVPFDSWALSDQYGPDQSLCHHHLPLRWANRAPNVPPERFAGTRTNSVSSHKKKALNKVWKISTLKWSMMPSRRTINYNLSLWLAIYFWLVLVFNNWQRFYKPGV